MLLLWWDSILVLLLFVFIGDSSAFKLCYDDSFIITLLFLMAGYCCFGAGDGATGFTLGEDLGEFFRVVAFVDVTILLSL